FRSEKDMSAGTILWDRSDNEFPSPVLNSTDSAAIASAAGWSLSGNDIDEDRAKDQKTAFTFDAMRDLSGSGAFEYMKMGVKYQQSKRSLFEANVLEADGDLFFEEDGFRGSDVNFADIGSPYSSIFAIDEGVLSNWRNVGFGLVDDGVLDNDYVDDGSIPLDEDTYSATEDILAGYIMAQANVGKWEIIGGVRVEQTEVSVKNLELVEDDDAGTETLTPIKTDSSYTDVLPRLQVNYRASDDLIFRGAVFASLARPEFQFIAGTTEIAIEDGTADIFLGNPNLDTAQAWNFDFGVEYYYGGIGILSANVFYKTIDGFIFNDDAPEGDGDASRFENDPRLAGLEIGDVETFYNGKTAEVYGLELNFIRQFTDLDGFWGGFGTYINLTLQESSADSGLEGRDDVEFFNAPGTIGTAAVTYQGERFEANLAYSYRDKFLFGFSQFQESIYEQDYDSLDFTTNFDVTDRIRLVFRATDITDDGTKAIVRRTFGSGNAYLDNSNYNGRNFTLGINARFR
ncbi:MAG: TonB-dependent receptor, partial [Woeseia sp.]